MLQGSGLPPPPFPPPFLCLRFRVQVCPPCVEDVEGPHVKARDAAAKALELDPSLAEAQTSLAMVSALYEWNWAAAEAQFRRAIEMNPGYVTAHHWLGVHLAAMGRFDEAKAELGKALSLDPKSAIVTVNFGYPDLYRRKYGEAQEVFQRALTISQDLPAAHEALAHPRRIM